MQNSLFGQILVPIDDLGHDVHDSRLTELPFPLDMRSQVPMRAVVHHNVDVSLGPEDVVALHDVLVLEVPVDFYFPLEQLQARRAEVSELDHLYSVPLQFPSPLHSLVDTATVPFPQNLVQQDLVFADFSRLLPFVRGADRALFGAAEVADGLGDRPLEVVFAFGVSLHSWKLK